MNDSPNRTVVVTGGAGFIGSHVCKALSQAGYHPVTFDNLSRGNRHAVKWGPLEELDIRERDRLLERMRHYRPQAVVHLAAFAYVGESVANPVMYYSNNVAGSLSVIEAALACGVSDLVFSSTCAVYGTPDRLPITEETPVNPLSPYGRSKAMIEQMLTDAHASHGLNSVSLRYFNAAGADPDGEIGEEHDPETHIIPLLLQTAKGQRPSFDIYGTNHPTPDGTCIRDFVHVTDIAAAHVSALDHLQTQGGTLIANLGNGQGHSVRGLINEAERITGCPIPVTEKAPRPGDPAQLYAAAHRAAQSLGWQPSWPHISDQIAHAWSFCGNT